MTIALKQVNEAPRAAAAPTTPRSRPRSRRSCCGRSRRTRARRFADADAFIAALQAARDGTATAVLAPVPAAAAGSSQRGLRLSPRSRWRRASRATGGRWWLWLLAVLVAGLGLAAVLLLPGTQKVSVPTVVGADQANAEAKLRQDGFHVDTVQKTAEQPAGQVIGQDPTGGTKAKKGSTVTLTVSAGPQQVAVPQVVGLTVSSARGRLQKAGLEASERERELRHRRPGQGDLGQPAGGPEGRQGLVGHARRLQRQAAGPGPRRRRQELRRSPVDPAGGRVQGHARRQGIRQGPGHGARAEPQERRADRRGLDQSRSPWPRSPARSPCPTSTGEDAPAAIAALSGQGFVIDQQSKDVPDRPTVTASCSSRARPAARRPRRARR